MCVIEPCVKGGFNRKYQSVKGIEMVGGRSFKPEAVFQNAVFELEQHAAFAEDSLLDERLVADGETNGGDGGVVPRLPIADARIMTQNGDGDFAEQLVFNGFMIFC